MNDSLLKSPVTEFNKNQIDLNAYFDRIEFKGKVSASYETLKEIHKAHTKAIPFENLNPLFRIPVLLDIDSIQQKIINEGRGGYCFEHNLLLTHALQEIGFNVKGLAARVQWNVPEGVIPARGHMLLLINLDGVQYVADTGFGGLTLPEPLILSPGVEQQTSHEPFRINDVGTEYVLQAYIKGEWKSLYSFTLQENLQPDYEVINYYLSTNLNSHFMHNLIAARVEAGSRFTLRNKEFAIHNTSGNTERREITDVKELKDLLKNVFRISVPAVEKAEEIFLQILSR